MRQAIGSAADHPPEPSRGRASRDVVLVHIKALFVDRVLGPAAMLFHVDRIHVAVFVERKRKRWIARSEF